MPNTESTILIRNQTRERLKRIGYKGQTYDELINVLLDLNSNKRVDSLPANDSANHQELISHG
ncbi:MAG: DUF7557 family protein [Nitrososphaeraceae archaeon]